MKLNPRHIRSTDPAPEWQKNWAKKCLIHCIDETTTCIFSSRLATNWPSLKIILKSLETRLLSLQNPTKADTTILLTEELNPQSLPHVFFGLRKIILLNCSHENLVIARAVRKQFPNISFTFLVTVETASLLRSFHTSGFPVRASDRFLTLSTRDSSIVKTIYPTNGVLSLEWLGYKQSKLSSGVPGRIIYAGRISATKNILELIDVYATAKKLDPGIPHLIIAGFEDKIGSQFNEIWVENYLEQVKGKVEALGLSEVVHFQEYLSGDEWQKFLASSPAIYISTSLNWDENHGVAPREFLECGHKVILPDWGGFGDLNKYHNCSLVPLKKASNGNAEIDIQTFAQQLIASVKDKPENEFFVLLPDDKSLSAFLDQSTTDEAVVMNNNIKMMHERLSASEKDQLYASGLYRKIHEEPLAKKILTEAYAPAIFPPKATSATDV